jgi:hypothetical protein
MKTPRFPILNAPPWFRLVGWPAVRWLALLLPDFGRTL